MNTNKQENDQGAGFPLSDGLDPDACVADELPDAWEQKAAKMIKDISAIEVTQDTRSRVNFKARILLECASQLRRAQHGV